MIFKTILLLLISSISYAKINVITTTTDLQWLTKQIGGEKVKVESLLNGTEDPHYLDAMPHFISKVANADMFCLVGLDLEVGWAPKILSRSGNKKVQPGGKGYCETGKRSRHLMFPQVELIDLRETSILKAIPTIILGLMLFIKEAKRF